MHDVQQNPILEEQEGVSRSGPLIALFAPSKSKKTYFGVLSDRALELYDSEKSFRKKKFPKHLLDLSTVFTLHNDHYDAKLKTCVCLMLPEDTLCLKAETQQLTNDWYLSLVSAVIPSRALKLGRPVQACEFFECAWDVEVVATPKVRKSTYREEEQLPNMCKREPGLAGPRRICFYPHTIILSKKRIEPAMHNVPEHNMPPFNFNDFYEIERVFMAFFGSQDRYFLIKMGRGSPTGGCELWMQCDSEEVASAIHLKLNHIIERETEKKKKMNEDNNCSISTFRTHHRERSHTQPMHMRTGSNGMLDRPRGSLHSLGDPSRPERKFSPVSSTSMIGRKSSGTLSRCSTMSNGTVTRPEQKSLPNSICGIFPATRRLSNTASIKEEPSAYECMSLKSQPKPSSSKSATSSSAAEETEDSGGTLRLDNGSIRDEHGSTRSSQKSLLIEATIESRSKATSSDTEDQSSVGGVSGVSAQSSSSVQDDSSYAPMGCAGWRFEANGHLIVPNAESGDRTEDGRSYASVSDSDSCYSSLAAQSYSTNTAANQPRAYSFGGRGHMKVAGHLVTHDTNNDCREISSVLLPPDDPRKRAFSLGSKFSRPFRKISSHAARPQRHSQTSTSGASLASSATSFGPSSSSSNHLATSLEREEYARNRSGSFGSGRSTPYNRRGANSSHSSSHNENDNHVEMEFVSTSLGRSGSGSVASIDSPSRSRTSSFGTRKDEFFYGPFDLDADIIKPNHLILLQAKQLSHEDNDYVVTEVPDERIQQAMSEHNSMLSPSEPFKPVELRQCPIETIQEYTSEKSSRSSSCSSIPQKIEEECGDEYAVMDCKASTSSGIVDTEESQPEPEPEKAEPKTTENIPLADLVADALSCPLSIPKRSSVPSSIMHCSSETPILKTEYSTLEPRDELLKCGSAPNDSFLASPGRSRSKSGIVFSEASPTQPPQVNYTTVKPHPSPILPKR